MYRLVVPCTDLHVPHPQSSAISAVDEAQSAGRFWFGQSSDAVSSIQIGGSQLNRRNEKTRRHFSRTYFLLLVTAVGATLMYKYELYMEGPLLERASGGGECWLLETTLKNVSLQKAIQSLGTPSGRLSTGRLKIARVKRGFQIEYRKENTTELRRETSRVEITKPVKTISMIMDELL